MSLSVGETLKLLLGVNSESMGILLGVHLVIFVSKVIHESLFLKIVIGSIFDSLCVVHSFLLHTGRIIVASPNPNRADSNFFATLDSKNVLILILFIYLVYTLFILE